MKTLIAIITLSLAGALPVHAAPLTEQDLTIKAPPCKTTKAKRPKLVAEMGPRSKEAIETKWYNPITADFNGDGWCDYAIGVPYPVNSHMNSYFLSELMLLGSKSGWLRPLHGKKPYLSPISDLPIDTWATDQVDLSDIQLIYLKAGGAPYVVGLFSGSGDAFISFKKWDDIGCPAMHLVQWMTVYRWNEKVGTFKKVDKRDSGVVLSFYYHTIKRRCRKH